MMKKNREIWPFGPGGHLTTQLHPLTILALENSFVCGEVSVMKSCENHPTIILALGGCLRRTFSRHPFVILLRPRAQRKKQQQKKSVGFRGAP